MSMAEVKQLVARTFVELGATAVFTLRETLFLEHGRCMAVSYRGDGLSAVLAVRRWNHRIPQRQGNILRTLSLPEEEKSASEAA